MVKHKDGGPPHQRQRQQKIPVQYYGAVNDMLDLSPTDGDGLAAGSGAASGAGSGVVVGLGVRGGIIEEEE